MPHELIEICFLGRYIIGFTVTIYLLRYLHKIDFFNIQVDISKIFNLFISPKCHLLHLVANITD